MHLRADRDVAGLERGDKVGWGHCTSARVKVGQKVSAGEVVAKSNGSPAHVHFVLIKRGAGRQRRRRQHRPFGVPAQDRQHLRSEVGGRAGPLRASGGPVEAANAVLSAAPTLGTPPPRPFGKPLGLWL